uniref:ATP synthase subunit b n=1 Tax=Nilaparvata lugens TaxID=108931 RepID=A0A4Y1N7G3_NILLU|nr:mitochondrial ATP synthase subunit b [Nilaparvata lugens]
MFSRLAFNCAKQVRPALIGAVRCSGTEAATSQSQQLMSKVAVMAPAASRQLSATATGDRPPWEGPERDLVNFPRPVMPEEPGKVRYLFVPEEWFEFFYKKTGVTGPYVLAFGIFNYVMSKEVWLIEHEYYYVYALAAIFYFGDKKFGKQIGDYLDKEIEADTHFFEKDRLDKIANFNKSIEEEKTLQWQKEADKLIIEAKRENVALQQEAIFRERAMFAYQEIKRRLDYQSQKQLMERRIAQKHMVEWIVANVLKAITPQQEADTLKKCIVDLQAMSAKA